MSRRVKQYRYSVSGRGAFPSDMLRYDNAKAATPEDQAEIDREWSRENHEVMNRARREIKLVGYCYPTHGRWESFMWSVVGSIQEAWVPA